MRFGSIAALIACAVSVPAAATTITFREGDFSPDGEMYYESGVVVDVLGNGYIFQFGGGLHADYGGPAPSAYRIFAPGYNLGVRAVTVTCCPPDEEEGYTGEGSLAYHAADGTILATLFFDDSLRGQRIRFAHTGGSYLTFGGNHVSITNLELTNIPEPATWAMMVGGIGFAGGTLRRRKASVSVSFS